MLQLILTHVRTDLIVASCKYYKDATSAPGQTTEILTLEQQLSILPSSPVSLVISMCIAHSHAVHMCPSMSGLQIRLVLRQFA